MAAAVTAPCTHEMLVALDEIAELVEEEAENGAFKAPIKQFYDAFFAACARDGLCDAWTPSVMLSLLRERLIRDETLPVENRISHAAAVTVIRDLLVGATQEQARLN